MSNILFKTAYNINYDKVVFDGTSISIGQLKKLINEKLQKSSKKIDFDLEITNADTNTVYQNDNETILKNSRVNVKRTLKNSTAPLRSQPPKPVNPTPVAPAVPVATVPTPAPTPVVTQYVQQAIQSNPTPIVTVPVQQPVAPVIPKPVVPTVTKPVYDSLAPLNIPSKPIVYVEETVKPVEINNDMSRMDEKAKLETILMNSMTKIVPDQNLTNKFLGINSRFLGVKPQINPADRPIPPGYICNTCRKPGHLRQFCPENGILPKPEERPKFPSGIPRSNLRPAQAGDKFAKLGPEGYVVTDMEREASKIIKKDKVLFDDDEDDVKKVEKKEIDDQNDHIPKELQCPYGGHLIKDAVLVPCCGHFVCCDECIKQKILNEEQIICPNKDCNQEIESLVSLTPFHEIRNKVKDYLKNSKALNESKDPFFDLILENVNNQELSSNLLINKLSPNGPKSPVQDSKISSSEKLLAEQQQQQQLQVSLNGGTNLNSPKKTDENKAELSPGQILPVQNSNFVPIPPPAQPTQFQPRPVRPNFNHGFNNYRPNIVPLTNNYSAPRPMMPMNNFNPMYRPHFQQQFDPMGVSMGMPMGPMGGPMPGPMVPPVNPGYMPPGMMNGPMNPMYQQQPMMPGMMPQNQPQMQGIMSKEEYYEYQEKLKKEAEIKLKSYKRSRSKSRGRYSRSRSRSVGRYKSSRYRKSRSRSRNRSRDRNYKRHSRSRSRSRRRTRSKSRDRSKRDSKSRSSRDRKMDKREDSKLKVIEEHKIETKKTKEKISDEPVDKKKKLDEDISERKVREVSVESSASERESGKESSGSKKHKKHKKSKKKHKRRSTSKH